MSEAWFDRRHYNALAKEIRELFPITSDFSEGNVIVRHDEIVERATLSRLALNLAKRFKADNPRFDPVQFLSACSPNVELYPISEMWED